MRLQFSKRVLLRSAAVCGFAILVVIFLLQPKSEIGSRSPAAVIELRFQDVDTKIDPKVIAREASDLTGLTVHQARKVHYSADALRGALWPGERRVYFDLFKDAKLSVRLMEPSPQLNRRGEFVGQVEGDSESRVQIWSTERRLSGEIVARGRSFRFVPVKGDVHFVIEVDPKSL